MKTIKEYLNEGLIKRQAGVDMKAKIEAWLNEHKIKYYTINDDLTIDVKVHVNLSKYTEKQLPDFIQFRTVDHEFRIEGSPNLETLRGCPYEVGDFFDCGECPNLKSLEGAPQKVVGSFWCNDCPKLESLEGAPQKVAGSFNCYRCGREFYESDVERVSKVNRGIYV